MKNRYFLFFYSVLFDLLAADVSFLLALKIVGEGLFTNGKDLFYFSYDPNTNSIKPYGYQYEEAYCGRAVPNGVMHRGAGCAMKIMRDNWEIKKDYPWK